MDHNATNLKNSDHRTQRRQRTLLGGKLVYGEMALTLDCVIQDVSETGARVRIPEGQLIPNRLWLIEPRVGLAREAEVVWRRHPSIGLHFVRTVSLHDVSTPHLQLLRRIWLETQLRTG